MDFIKRYNILHIAELILIIAVLAVAMRTFAIADALTMTVAFGVAYLVPSIAYSRMRNSCKAGRWLLLAVTALLVAVSIINIQSWTIDAGCTFASPRLTSDDGRYYYYAKSLLDGTDYDRKPFVGVSYVMLAMWKVLGMSVVYPVALNIMLLLWSIVLSGCIAVRLFEGRVTMSSRKLSLTAMAFLSIMFYYLGDGVRVQKEAILGFSFAVMGCYFARMANGIGWQRHSKRQWMEFAATIAAFFLVIFTRPNYTPLVMAGALVVALGNFKLLWKEGLVLLLCACGVYYLGSGLQPAGIERFVGAVAGCGYDREFIVSPSQLPYTRIIGNYFAYPIYVRLAMLPLSLCVQFIVPFPWVYDGFGDLPSMLPRLGWTWYAVGSLVLFFYLGMGWKRRHQFGLYPLWVLICYCTPAYMVAGSLTRYILPFMPIMVPIAAYVVANLADGYNRKLFKLFAVLFVILLVAALVWCYYTQVSYLESIGILHRPM